MALAALCLVLVPLAGPARAATATNSVAGSVANSVAASVALAAQAGSDRGVRTGVAVLDLATGQYTGAGEDGAAFASQSVVKVLIATQLLLTGQMRGATEQAAYQMITRSDDRAADALYPQVGGEVLLDLVGRHYDVGSLGSASAATGWWGLTRVTPKGLVYLYAAIARDPAVYPWLFNAMAHATRVAADGSDQFFGLPAATTTAAIKQGWGHDGIAGGGPAVANSTGYVGGRFAVAILTEGPAESYGEPLAGIVTAQAKALLPHGRLGDSTEGTATGLAAGGPAGLVDAVVGGTGSVTVSGDEFDPALGAGQAPSFTVSVDGGPSLVQSAGPQLALPASGAGSVAWSHYSVTLSAPAGRHTVTVAYTDAATGRSLVRGSWTVEVQPSATQHRQAMLFRAWLGVLAVLALLAVAAAGTAVLRVGRRLRAGADAAEEPAVRGPVPARPLVVRLGSGQVVRISTGPDGGTVVSARVSRPAPRTTRRARPVVAPAAA